MKMSTDGLVQCELQILSAKSPTRPESWWIGCHTRSKLGFSWEASTVFVDWRPRVGPETRSSALQDLLNMLPAVLVRRLQVQ